ncbi:MAG: hypothetical protein KJ936_12870 [Proteobacteria bacterium]|nr:hypothetical protein [Pseudomonadota bacterium]
MTKGEAQRSIRSFYEAVKIEDLSGGKGPLSLITPRKTSMPQRPPYCILALLLLPVLGLAFSGCAGVTVSARPASYDSPESALRALAVSGSVDEAVTATARILIDRHGEKYPLKVALMMKRPAHLRLESIPLMGPPDFFLSVSGGELRAFLPGKGGGSFYIGRATPQNLSRFFPLALPADEMIPLLMGLPPAEGETPFSLSGEWEQGLYRVDRHEAGRKVRSLWIDPAVNLITRIRTFGEGEAAAYTADFSEHARVGKGFLPQRLVISGDSFPEMTVRYTDPQQIAADQASFALPVPEGVTPIILDN